MTQAKPKLAVDWLENWEKDLQAHECLSWALQCLGVIAQRAAHGLPKQEEVSDLSASGPIGRIAQNARAWNPAWEGELPKDHAKAWDAWPFFAVEYYRTRLSRVLDMTPKSFAEIVPAGNWWFKSLDKDWLAFFESDRQAAREAGESEDEAFETARRKRLYDLAMQCKKNQGLVDGRGDGILLAARAGAEAASKLAEAEAQTETAKAEMYRAQGKAAAEAEARKRAEEKRDEAEKARREAEKALAIEQARKKRNKLGGERGGPRTRGKNIPPRVKQAVADFWKVDHDAGQPMEEAYDAFIKSDYSTRPGVAGYITGPTAFARVVEAVQRAQRRRRK